MTLAYEWVNRVFENYKEFQGPFYLESDSDYLPDLTDRLNLLYEKLDKNGCMELALENAGYIRDGILDAINLYYQGQIIEAQKKIDLAVEFLCGFPLVISNIKNSVSFRDPELLVYKDYDGKAKRELEKEYFLYHARLQNGIWKYAINDMLHIPFDKRDIIKPQRFSIPGLPCYYLGSTSYCCWLEMDNPADHLFIVSAVSVDDNVRIFNLSFPMEAFCNIARDYKDRMMSYVPGPEEQYEFDDVFYAFACMRFLDIATSYKVKRSSSDAPFKSEYIVSQMVMNSVMKLGYDGIAYFSKKCEERFASPHCVNLALFAKYNGEQKYSDLCKKIKLTKPTNYADFKQIRFTYLGDCEPVDEATMSTTSVVPIGGSYYDYGSTYFSMFDRNFSRMKVDNPKIE